MGQDLPGEGREDHLRGERIRGISVIDDRKRRTEDDPIKIHSNGGL